MQNVNTIRTDFKKWQVVLTLTIATGVLLAILFLKHGFTEEGFSLSLRATGRISFVIFLMTFLATSLVQLFPSSLTLWMSTNRRYLGLSFSMLYGYHALGFLGIFWLTQHPGVEGVELIASVVSYVFLVVMTVSSFSRFARLLSPWLWDSIHTVGMWTCWYFFLQEFIHKAEEVSLFMYLPLVLLTIGAAVLRWIAEKQPKRQRSKVTVS
jgi:methionine sulfoxide reductase heme-binding subunit